MNTLPHEWLGDLATYIDLKNLVTFLKVDSYVYLSLLISCFKLYTHYTFYASNTRISFISYNYFQYKDWRKNGKPWERFYCINGKHNGQYKDWYPNGKPWVRCHNKNGQEHGKYEKCNRDGQIIEQSYYKNGKLL